MEINLEELTLAMRELKFTIDEAKNLVFHGKVVQCDRKLQGAQVKCDNILGYVALRLQEDQAEQKDGNVANEAPQEEIGS